MTDTAQTPKMSVLVIGYKMSRQLRNTLYTLSPSYQRGVSADDYEVVVVENASSDPMGEAALAGLTGTFRYAYRHETGVSPAPALNQALAMARGEYVGIMIDGARMLTPGVVRNALDVFAIDPDAVVATLGFHLGHLDQQELSLDGYGAEQEQALLAGLPEHGDGYRMFEIACLSLSNPHGYLHPMMESNCVFTRRANYEAIGAADERFDQVGGGVLNLDIYRELVELPATTLYTLPGEGSFHQFHGGVTTQHNADRDQLMQEFRERYEEVRGKAFRSPIKEPQWFGEIPPSALPILHQSATKGIDRWFQRTALDDPVWAVDVTVPREAPELMAEFEAREKQYVAPPAMVADGEGATPAESGGIRSRWRRMRHRVRR